MNAVTQTELDFNDKNESKVSQRRKKNSRSLSLDIADNPQKVLTPQFEIDFKELVLEKQISEGGYGLIFKGKWRESVVAIKMLKAENMKEESINDFLRECQSMHCLRHPNIVMFLGACTKPPNFAIVLEFCPRGSLWSFLQNLDINLNWEDRKRFALDTAKAMNYLHCFSPAVLHRDLKRFIFVIGFPSDIPLVSICCWMIRSVSSWLISDGPEIKTPSWPQRSARTSGWLQKLLWANNIRKRQMFIPLVLFYGKWPPESHHSDVSVTVLHLVKCLLNRFEWCPSILRSRQQWFETTNSKENPRELGQSYEEMLGKWNSSNSYENNDFCLGSRSQQTTNIQRINQRIGKPEVCLHLGERAMCINSPALYKTPPLKWNNLIASL